MGREILLDALSELCNANVVSLQTWQKQNPGKAVPSEAILSIGNFLSKVFEADKSRKGPESGRRHITVTTITYEIDGVKISTSKTTDGLDGPTTETQSHPGVPPTHESTDWAGSQASAADYADSVAGDCRSDSARIRSELIVNEDEFFDPKYDYDFTKIHDKKAYTRGGEEYGRPYGWNRLALKVKNKYPDGNGWLGSTNRSTSSETGEWPVSYHGTTEDGAKGIIQGHYKAGSRELYGHGVYSTPKLKEAEQYCSKNFTCKATGKKYKVMLQNRINPQYREITKRKYYWLVRVPNGTQPSEEKEIIEMAICPYGLLLKAV